VGKKLGKLSSNRSRPGFGDERVAREWIV
jgi:hypothetical protein